MWKGISEYIGLHAEYARVIGAASVGNRNDPTTRALPVEALHAWRSEPLLGALVNPRRPFKPRYSMRSLFGEVGLRADMNALGSLIEDREADGKDARCCCVTTSSSARAPLASNLTRILATRRLRKAIRDRLGTRLQRGTGQTPQTSV